MADSTIKCINTIYPCAFIAGYPIHYLKSLKIHDFFAFNKAKSAVLVMGTVYTPSIISFLRQAKICGLETVNQFYALLHQAVPGFELWFRIRPQVTEKLWVIPEDMDKDKI
ncbi:shikimate 5-dehydrogenase [Bartonella australis AUST/NH1]|uniref:Shikimate 5-dehydrogenase n=1 Tax=Bartonella australis (strain Aust/NH1) TaxID=1094489 RepID=M1NWN5_BARAA|nr:shikimate 5-dehydrogenase [Bartonella australis]AGF73897.1 shikimate 5-dehydrogenase [Bartonella australis AUST/NH1]